jgi:hypothetical protein
VTKFFQSIVYGEANRIECQIDETAFKAGNCQVLIALNLSPQERKLFAALRARNKRSVRFHLAALGFLGRTPP